MSYKNNFIYLPASYFLQKKLMPLIFNGHCCMQMNSMFIRITLAALCLIVPFIDSLCMLNTGELGGTELFSMTEAVLKTGESGGNGGFVKVLSGFCMGMV